MPDSATDREAAARAAFREQAGWCERLGSPFTALLCATLAERLDTDTDVGRRILGWAGDPRPEFDNLPARTCGAFHFLVRGGEAPGLARLYPPSAPPDPDALWAAAAPLLRTAEATFHTFLDNPPQTNEVGRSAVLMSGLLAIAARFRLPLRLFELGSSAGLNLALDRYRYDLGGRETGDPASPLTLAPAWTGPPPPKGEVRILARRGVDLSPLSPVADAERLLAFVWADQRERIARLETALSVVSADPPAVERGDAAQWLERVLPESPAQGEARVVLHSIAFQYFPRETQRRIEALMERLGAEANEGSPLAWLAFEQRVGDEKASLTLRAWPDGKERLLAWTQPHGRFVEWLS